MMSKVSLRPLSLSFRLVSFMSVIAVVAFLTFSLIMLSSVERHFEEQDVNDLMAKHSSISHILGEKGEDLNVLIDKVRIVTLEQNNISIYLENEKGNVVFKTANAPDFESTLSSLKSRMGVSGHNSFNVPNDVMFSASHSDSMANKAADYRVMVSPVKVYLNDESVVYTLIIAMSTDFHFHYIQELKSNLAIAAFFICLFIIFMVLISVYKGHAPLRKVSRKIASITSENLNTRLDPNTVPIELSQFVVSFNVMLERIEDVFKRQSNFSADIAHEMRTPITNLVTQTQFALNQARSVDEYQELLYSSLEEYERMSKMVSDMLFLSQADNDQLVIDVTSINLYDETIKVFEYFEAWAEEKGVALNLEGDPLFVQGDPSMLRRVISNLLSNAIRYTPQGKAVTVALSDNENEVCLAVCNPGEPIPQEHLHHLFDRFYRTDQSRQRKGNGSGIGLAIVKSIVEAHRGRVSVSSDPQASCFKIFLPKK